MLNARKPNGWHELNSCIEVIKERLIHVLDVVVLRSKCVSEMHYK